MRRRIRISPVFRFGIAALITAVMLSVAGCSDGGADPAAYFDGLEQSQAALYATVGELYDTPTARELERFADDDPSELTGDQEVVVRRFVTEFWTGAAGATAVHRDEIQALDVPEVAEDAHRDYVQALDDLIATRDQVISEAQTIAGTELLASFWEPDPHVAAVNDTCLAMAAVAAAEGFTITVPLCTDE